MNCLRFLLLASAASLPAIPAHAQSDGEIVVVASGVEQPADETGRSVTVIDRDEIERRQALSVSDLIATTPGASVSRYGGIGTVTNVRLRGAEGEQTLVLIDGVRVNDPSSPGGAFDFGNLLAGAVERVEVLRGPNSVVWGSQAIGGVVNVATLSGEDGFAARGSAEYGGNETRVANASVAGGNALLSGAVTAGYLETDGISAAAVGSEPDGYRQVGATGRLKLAFAPGFALDLRGYYADSRAELDGYPAPAYSFADTQEYSTAQELYGYAGLTAELFGGKLRNRISVTAADIDRDNYDPAFGTAPSFYGRGNSERYEYQGDADLGVARAVFGAEHEDSRFTDGATTADTGITSVYGQLIVSPVAPLTLTAGIRHDDHRQFGNHTSLGANAALEIVPGTLLRASYGEGFKAPTLYQLYSFYGTATLVPEKAESWEAGAEQRFLDGRVMLGATWFHRDTSNQIDFDLATFTYANIARTRAQGIEIEAVAQPTAGLSLRAAYTHVTAENRSPGANLGNDLARRPRDIGSLSVDYRLPSDLSLGGTILVVGDSFDDAGNNVPLQGYALVGIRAEMPVLPQVALYGRVENLINEHYQTVAGYGSAGRTAHIGLRVKLD